MSTYYYLVCDRHEERTDAASQTTVGKGCRYGDSDETLYPFIVTHCRCKVRIVSEHDDDDALDFEEWTAENANEMYLKQRDE